jgi:hypothetical protein
VTSLAALAKRIASRRTAAPSLRRRQTAPSQRHPLPSAAPFPIAGVLPPWACLMCVPCKTWPTSRAEASHGLVPQGSSSCLISFFPVSQVNLGLCLI